MQAPVILSSLNWSTNLQQTICAYGGHHFTWKSYFKYLLRPSHLASKLACTLSGCLLISRLTSVSVTICLNKDLIHILLQTIMFIVLILAWEEFASQKRGVVRTTQGRAPRACIPRAWAQDWYTLSRTERKHCDSPSASCFRTISCASNQDLALFLSRMDAVPSLRTGRPEAGLTSLPTK
jgi:hypothetical protein